MKVTEDEEEELEETILPPPNFGKKMFVSGKELFKLPIDDDDSEPQQEVKKKKRTEYEYTSIAQIDEEGFYNLYGVVSLMHPPKKSNRGTGDYIETIILRDPSSDQGVTLNVFAASIASLPKVLAGDILRVHRVKVSSF